MPRQALHLVLLIPALLMAGCATENTNHKHGRIQKFARGRKHPPRTHDRLYPDGAGRLAQRLRHAVVRFQFQGENQKRRGGLVALPAWDKVPDRKHRGNLRGVRLRLGPGGQEHDRPFQELAQGDAPVGGALCGYQDHHMGFAGKKPARADATQPLPARPRDARGLARANLKSGPREKSRRMHPIHAHSYPSHAYLYCLPSQMGVARGGNCKVLTSIGIHRKHFRHVFGHEKREPHPSPSCGLARTNAALLGSRHS